MKGYSGIVQKHKVYTFLCIYLSFFLLTCQTSKISSNQFWAEAEKITNQIHLPHFPSRDYIITNFGAMGNGQSDCKNAFDMAIKKCSSEGGGKIIVPKGTFLVNGPIHLKSNINLHLEEGAIIKFNSEPAYYLPAVLTRWEGTELYNYSPFIYTSQATNVAITGKGTIDGNAKKSFATWNDKQGPAQTQLRQMGSEGTPVYKRVFGKGDWLRPSMIQFYSCKNVLVEGVTILDSPFWIIHPVFCYNVTIKNVTVNSWNLNNDGCDPESSVNVLIEQCQFNTGDDAVAIKSGRDQDGWRIGQATENIIIRNCEMNSHCNGLCIGSEMSGSVRNVFMENCRVGEANSTIYFKSNLDRGGLVENVFIRNINVQRAKNAFIRFETSYHGYRGNNFPPVFRNFNLENIACHIADRYAISAVGTGDAIIKDVHLRDITVDSAQIIANHAFTENFTLNNVEINGQLVPPKLEQIQNDNRKLKLGF